MLDEWYRISGDSHYQYPFDEDDLVTERDELTIEHESGETNRSTVSTARMSTLPRCLSQSPHSPSHDSTLHYLLTPSMSSRREELSYQAPSRRLENLSRWEPPYGTPYAPLSPSREPEEQKAMKTPILPVPMQKFPRRASTMLPTREPVPSSHKTPTALPPLEVQPSAVLTTLPSSAPSPVTVSCHSVVSPVCQSTCQRNAPSQLGYEGNQG
jgi:hypothetical protein